MTPRIDLPAGDPSAIAAPSSVRDRSSMVVTIGQLAVLPITVLLWHVVAVNGWVDPLVSRTPDQVWDYLVEGWRSGEIVDNLAATMEAVVIAFVLASVVGVVAGIALALLPRTERILSPYLDALNAMPRIALAPIFIVYFGLDTSAKVALAFTIVVFVTLTNARAGVHSADHDVVRLTTVLGANKRQVFTKVYLPVSAPAIFGGLRLGLIYALLGVVGSELIAARDGLGQLIAKYAGVFRMEAVYGLLIVLAVVAAAINTLMRWVERWVLRWQPRERG